MTRDALEGQSLGKYRIMEPLGRGGMARVYLAYHAQLDRYVAIKVLRSDLVEEEEFLARFKREARAVAALRHPNIVQVFDFDVRGDLYYMVMELLEGDTLRRRLNDYRVRDERMPLGEALRILLDVLDGLAYAHSEGMIHRDLKPENILLTKRGQAVLTDFGIAQIVGGTRYTVSGALMGTLSYMAPEQGLEGHCDARSDIYSLGIVLYEILTGEPPFDADTPLAILMKHINDPLPMPRKIEPDIPKSLERVVLKALSKRPGDRYQSAEEMAHALREAAVKAKLTLPDWISLPLSFTTAEAPSESVAVLSGTAREKVSNAEFSTEDTDARLGERLAAELQAAQGRTEAQAEAEPAVRPAAWAGQLAVQAQAQAQRELARAHAQAQRELARASARAERLVAQPPVPPQPGDAAVSARAALDNAGLAARQALDSWLGPLPEADGPVESQGLGRALLWAGGVVAIVNLLVIFFSLITNAWGTFGRGWPFELLLVGLALCSIMEATASVWLLIPVGIGLGNGFLMAFYAITNAWGLWSFLWPLEPLLVLGTVFFTIWLSNQDQGGRRIARHLAHALKRPTIIAIPIVIVLGAMLG